MLIKLGDVRNTRVMAAMVACWLVVVTLRLVLLYYCATTLDVAGASKEFVHFLQRNSLRLRDKEVDIEYQETVYTGKH